MKKQKRSFKYLYIALAVGAIVVIAAVVFGLNRSGQNSTSNDTFYPKASEIPVTTSSPTPTSTAGGTSPRPTVTPTPIPTSAQPQTGQSGVLTITSPTQGATVNSGTTVTGTSNSSSMLYFRLKGAKSGQLTSGTVMPSGGKFSFDLAFTNQVAGGRDQGVLEVYSVVNGGTEANNVNVSVEIRG